MSVALITGITGQDGSYLAEFLLAKGYHVVGMVRRSSTVDFERIAHIQDQIEITHGDLADQGSLYEIFETYKPDEVYNLGGQSDVQLSWTQSVLTADSTALGVARILDCLRQVTPKSKFYQASTSEMFGDAGTSPQNEQTPLNPRNPYGIAKVYAHLLTQNYRKHYGLFAVAGILYNHESPRRGMEFVTRKITHTVARIVNGQADELRLGNLECQRDWGFAGDYVRAMWLMLQQGDPDDYVIGSGHLHTVRDFCRAAFEFVGLDYQDYVIQDPQFFRPVEEYPLLANPSYAREQLGWKPEVGFEDLVRLMVEADLKALEK
ncbi:MAG: GDP-mannose 4,6-dehydratase [Anaerolineaceae bacterium]|nr:GDP-mannose 4,6-dehydratase [Anaerolineaceae bacterium]